MGVNSIIVTVQGIMLDRHTQGLEILGTILECSVPWWELRNKETSGAGKRVSKERRSETAKYLRWEDTQAP